jgi:hypothetical protein
MSLTTLTNCKLYLSIDPLDTSQDDLLNFLILEVEALISSYCKRVFETATYTAEQHNILHNIYTDQFPIQSIITINRICFDLYDPIIVPVLEFRQFQSYVQILDGQYVTMTNKLQYLNHEESYVEITYVAGYDPDNIPVDLSMAATKLVALEYKISDENRIGLESYSEGGIHEIYYKNQDTELPITISSVLDRYKSARV